MKEDARELIRELAEKLGTTTEYLWQVLIKQAEIQGWVNVGWAVLLGLVFLFCTILIARLVRRILSLQAPDAEFAVSVVGALGSMAMAVVLFLLCSNIQGAISCFCNPEYWALRQILSKL